MDYRSFIAGLASQVINKGVDISDIHVSRLETAWSIGYRQGADNFIADKWFPLAPVGQIAGLYPKWSKELFYTDRAGTYKLGDIPPQGELKVDTPGTFVCQRYAFEIPMFQDLPFVADAPYNLDYAATQVVTDVLQLHKERMIADAYFKAGVWDIDWTGVASGETGTDGQATGETFRQFNDADSDPLATFANGKMAIKKKVGLTPNTVVVGEQVYEKLRINPQLISIFRNPQAADKVPTKLNEAMIAQALDVDNLIVARAMYNTAKPGDTVVLDWIFGKGMWLGYVTKPGLMVPLAGMNLSFNQPLGGFDTAITKVPDLHAHTEYTQGFQCWCPVVMASGAGLFMASAVA